MTEINNTTSRSELVDRCIRVELIAASALCGQYNGFTGAQGMALDIIDALKGNVTVTEQPGSGLPPT